MPISLLNTSAILRFSGLDTFPTASIAFSKALPKSE